jgi:hypothetical protein
MDFTVCWHFAKLAKDRPEYRDRKFDDGATAAEHYRAWNDYFVVYCRERARKGPCVEMMCPGYNSVWLKGFYNFHDFGDAGPALRRDADGPLLGLLGAGTDRRHLRRREVAHPGRQGILQAHRTRHPDLAGSISESVSLLGSWRNERGAERLPPAGGGRRHRPGCPR